MRSELLKNKKIDCAFCQGSGIQERSEVLKITCVACKGAGSVSFDCARPCAYCGGEGRSILNRSLPCSTCQGIGVIQAVNPLNMCGHCGGKGIKPGIDLACTKCRGRGINEVKKYKVEKT